MLRWVKIGQDWVANLEGEDASVVGRAFPRVEVVHVGWNEWGLAFFPRYGVSELYMLGPLDPASVLAVAAHEARKILPREYERCLERIARTG